MNGVCRQSLWAKTPRQFTAQNRPDHTIGVADGQGRLYWLAVRQGRLGEVKECLVIERIFQPMILRNLAIPAHLRPGGRLVENGGEVQALGFPVVNGSAWLYAIHPSYHLADRAETEPGHMLTHFLGDEVHEIDHMRR